MVKNSLAGAGDKEGVEQSPGWGKSPGGENVFPLQNCLENPRDSGAEPMGSQRVRRDRATECTCPRGLTTLRIQTKFQRIP